MLLSNADWALLTDPVCGRTVEADSPHRVIHGGALFAFCSAACRAQFVELPSRYAIIASALAHAEPRVKAPMAAAAPSTAPLPPAAPPAPQAIAPQPAASEHGSMALAPLPDTAELAGAQGPFSWLLAWRERRFANACARDMLRLRSEFASRYPELKGPSLYRRVAAARVGDDLAAEAVLQHAKQSFAIWPVERELTFRDVVHYLAVQEFVAAHPDARWVVADMKRVVDAVIPAHL
jgi:YHS domain-containing protein